MPFVQFKKTGSRSGAPRISIWKSGQIGFSSSVSVGYKINIYKYASLFFDEDTNRVGIRLTNDENEDGISKLINRKDGGASFSARSFLKAYRIDYSKTINYKFEYDKENNMFIFKPEMKESKMYE